MHTQFTGTAVQQVSRQSCSRDKIRWRMSFVTVFLPLSPSFCVRGLWIVPFSSPLSDGSGQRCQGTWFLPLIWALFGFICGPSFCLRVISSQVAWATDFCQITSLLAASSDFSRFLLQHGSPWLADAVAMVSDVAWERKCDWLSRLFLLTPRLLWSPANLLITGLSGGCCWAASLEADLLRQSRRAESLHFSERSSFREACT